MRQLAETLARLANTSNGEGLQWRVWGFCDALQERACEPQREQFTSHRAWKAARHRYRHGLREGELTRVSLTPPAAPGGRP